MAGSRQLRRPLRGPMTPVPYRVVSRAPRDGGHVDAPARAARRPGHRRSPGSSTCSTRSASARCRSRPVRRPRRAGRLVHTIRDVGAVSHALVARGAGLRDRRARPVRHDLAARGGERPRPRHRRRRHRPRAAAPGRLPRPRPPRRLRVRLRPRRRAHAGRTCCSSRELEDWRGRFDVELDVTVDNARRATGTGASASSRQLIPRAPFDPATPSPSSAGRR